MATVKALGGIAPFGYRWKDGQLVVDEAEASVRKLIYNLFLKHRRKKTVAKLLNDLGYRTRGASRFSDTTIDRLLRDTTAKGIREAKGTIIQVEPIVSTEIWERVNNILGSKPSKQATALFTGIAYCGCGGKMIVPSNTPKYVCVVCRRKIHTDDIDAIFHTQLEFSRDSENDGDIFEHWLDLTKKEKRILIEQICERIVIERDTITIRLGFGFSPRPFKAVTDEQQDTLSNERQGKGAEGASITSIREPLLSEAGAAAFLGVSKMTMLRKRNAGEIGYFRIGFRILYSKETHLIPYLNKCEGKVLLNPRRTT
jgi:hypothetical protein